jgi:hypothetical protein
MMPENQRGKAFEFVEENGDVMVDDEGNALRYNLSSEIAICQPEFCSFAGKSSYMEGLIPYLLNMFDAPKRWARVTKNSGTEVLEDVLVNMIGGSAPAAVKESLPVPATADGFLSRCLIVYQSSTSKEYFKPTIPDLAPTMLELRKRLAWIASNTFGEWEFSDEAEAWLSHWYHQYKVQLLSDGLFMGVKSRLDVIMYRVATLIRWQRYERDDNLVHLRDVQDAEKLLTKTFREAIPMYRMLFDRKASDKSLKVEEHIKRVKHVDRMSLIRNAHVPAEEAYYAVERLKSEGLITITLNNVEQDESTRSPKEIYHWVEELEERRVLNDKPNSTIFTRKQMIRTKKEAMIGRNEEGDEDE